MRSKRIAVIGAGIAGLSAAYELKKLGFDVVVFEKNAHPGGRMSTRTTSGLPFDLGADFMIDGWYSLLQSYAEELGVEWVLSEQGSKPRVIRGGVPYYIDILGPKEVLSFKLLSFRARVSFLIFLARVKFFSGKLDFFDLTKNPESLEEVSAGEYIRTKVHKEVYDYIGDPFVSIMQFHRADEISSSALFSFIQAMMDVSRKFRVSYTPGGMGMIPRALAEKLGVRYGIDIISVAPKDGRVEVVHGRGADIFDAVIVATTGNATQKLLKLQSPSLQKMLAELKYASTMTVGFMIPADLFPDNAHLNYVPFVENQVVSGYDNTVRKSKAAVKEGRSVMTVYLHEEAAKKYWNTPNTELFEIVKEELLKVCPDAQTRAREVEAFDVERWSHAMPKFTGAYSKTVRAFLKDGQGDNNIFLVGDYLNSPWTEGAARLGKRTALKIGELFS